MTTQEGMDKRSATNHCGDDADTVIGFAVLGCLVVGGIGIFKAFCMQNGLDVLLCLLGSVAAFGMIFYIYFRRD